MSVWLKVFAIVLLLITTNTFAESHRQALQSYIQLIYGSSLTLSDVELEQLSWVMDNPEASPEQAAAVASNSIHREVPRALARLYNLKLLYQGGNQAYREFIAPQLSSDSQPLSYQDFSSLSNLFKNLTATELETLSAAAIISAVALSPKAKTAAAAVFHKPLPQDSIQFLSLTASKAGDIYPLARSVIDTHPSAARLFTIVFFPGSHFRHMMYNEGSLNMYLPLKKAVAEKRISKREMQLWYSYWVDNIAGFRGHISPRGSIYLTENTYRAMTALWQQLEHMTTNVSWNPMAGYLKIRSQWLGINNYQGVSENEKLSLAALGATLRLFTPEQGRTLLQAFRSLTPRQQADWVYYQNNQRQLSDRPSPTYAPALFSNALMESNLKTVVEKLVPFYLQTTKLESQLRDNGKLGSDTPLSFFSVSRPAFVIQLLNSKTLPAFDIDPDSGQIKLLP